MIEVSVISQKSAPGTNVYGMGHIDFLGSAAPVATLVLYTANPPPHASFLTCAAVLSDPGIWYGARQVPWASCR